MKKLYILSAILFNSAFSIVAQVNETQTWEVHRPGATLFYDLNACNDGTPEPSTDDYFFCEGPDRVIVKGHGLSSGGVTNFDVFDYNGDIYIAFANNNGLNIYNKTQDHWKTLPSDEEPANNQPFQSTSVKYAENGLLVVSTQSPFSSFTFNLDTNAKSTIDSFANERFEKNTNSGSTFEHTVYGIYSFDRRLIAYKNGVTTVVGTQNSSGTFEGLDIGLDDKVYVAYKNQGLYIYDPSTGTSELKTPDNSDLPNQHLRDISVDANGDVWMTYHQSFNVGGLIHWDISEDVYTTYLYEDGSQAQLPMERLVWADDALWISPVSFSSQDQGLLKFQLNNDSAEWEFFDDEFFIAEGLIATDGFSTNNNGGTANDIRFDDETLYVAFPQEGLATFKNENWSRYDPLQNNLPSGFGGGFTTLLQNKNTGGVSMSYVPSGGFANRSADVFSSVSTLSTDNVRLGRKEYANTANSMQITAEGQPYAVTLEDGEFGNDLSALEFPFWQEQLPNENLNQSLTYTVQGENKWAFFKAGSTQRLVNLDADIEINSNDSNLNLSSSSSFPYITEGRDGRIWALSSSDGITWYDPINDVSGILIIPNANGIFHNEFGSFTKIVFASENNKLWLMAQGGFVYVEDDMVIYERSQSDNSIFQNIRDIVSTQDNTLYGISNNGIFKLTNADSATPTLAIFNAQDSFSGIGPEIFSLGKIAIDNVGDIWMTTGGFSGNPRLIRLDDENTSPGITNGADDSQLVSFISGRAFFDINNNGTYEAAIDGVMANQNLVVQSPNSTVNIYTDLQGIYRLPIYNVNQANVTYQFALPQVDGFYYNPERYFEVDVMGFDQDYPNNDIAFPTPDTQSLFIKGAPKLGAFGFQRSGFQNQFVYAIGNLSSSKTFGDVKGRYTFTAPYATIDEVKIFKVVNNTNGHIINQINIAPDLRQSWSVNLDPSQFTVTEIASPEFTISETSELQTIEFSVGDMAPFDAYVIQVNTGLFDGTQAGEAITAGITAISANNFNNVSGRRLMDDFIDTTPDDENGRSGRHEDHSPYESPADIYEDRDGVFQNPEDVYSDSPYEYPIVSSFDPNDKLVTPGVPDMLNETNIDRKWLTYTIRFQNDGNFSAKDVVITDVLDDNFDAFSFRFIEASHPVVVDDISTEDETIKRFTFNDIFLPDSDTDFDGSQGYVKFQIKALEDIAENTVVENTASIYFDQNPPIVTNTIQNIFVQDEVLATVDITISEGLKLYPNPTTYKINIANLERASSFDIYSILGQKVLSGNLSEANDSIDVSNLQQGVYLIRIGDNDKYSTLRFVKQ